MPYLRIPSLSDHMNRQLSARDHRMARTICTICLGYLFCNMPIIVMKLVRGNDTDDIPYVRLVVTCLYFMQYRLVHLDIVPKIRLFPEHFLRRKYELKSYSETTYGSGLNSPRCCLYSLNFVVYAASNKQYREAYLLYLREAVFCLDKETAATSSAANNKVARWG